MTFRLTAGAEADATAAIRAYNAQPGRLGSAFQVAFEAAVAAIAANPRLHPPCDDGRPGCEDRQFYIARFQQRVIFTIVGDDVFVLTVVHASRREGSWHRRIDPTL